MARFRDPKRQNRDDGFASIPYGALAPQFLGGRAQTLVPFLGAGASLQSPPAAAPTATPTSPAVLEQLASQLNATTSDARLFLEIALAIIGRLNALGDSPGEEPTAFERVRTSTFAPSAGDLAQALAEAGEYDYFNVARQRVTQLTGRTDWDRARLSRLLATLSRLTAIGSPAPPLLDASSYYTSHTAREVFWDALHSLFENKHRWTPTHHLVADAADQYMAANRDVARAADFLVVTTNYDALLEDAFDQQNVPYCVLTVSHPRLNAPSCVNLRFSATVQAHLGLTDPEYASFKSRALSPEGATGNVAPGRFAGLGAKSRPLAIVYKIHGTLDNTATAAADSVIITNEDYLSFLSARVSVPDFVTTRLRNVGLLLLGYSFTDWNIRSLYSTITEARQLRDPSAPRDYAVMLSPSPYEVGFFERNLIDIFETPLDLFCERMTEHRPRP